VGKEKDSKGLQNVNITNFRCQLLIQSSVPKSPQSITHSASAPGAEPSLDPVTRLLPLGRSPPPYARRHEPSQTSPAPLQSQPQVVDGPIYSERDCELDDVSDVGLVHVKGEPVDVGKGLVDDLWTEQRRPLGKAISNAAG
jgi:hypothetical protein